ncbi:hypothetical protein D3C80_1695670 [compost metagenome]
MIAAYSESFGIACCTREIKSFDMPIAAAQQDAFCFFIKVEYRACTGSCLQYLHGVSRSVIVLLDLQLA